MKMIKLLLKSTIKKLGSVDPNDDNPINGRDLIGQAFSSQQMADFIKNKKRLQGSKRNNKPLENSTRIIFDTIKNRTVCFNTRKVFEQAINNGRHD